MTAQTATALDLDLAERARSGDRQALASLYEQYRPALLRHARRMISDDAAAADIVQESYLRAIAAMPKTRSEKLLFRAWIFRIATNLCLRELTRRSRYASDALHEERTGDDANGPDQHRRRIEVASLVERALGRLPPRYRQILILRELDELSYEELGEVLELKLAAVKVTLHRARTRFAALFVAEQLLANAEAQVDCAALQRLVDAADRRKVERHLEQCAQCRRVAERPAAELFALLPPLAPLPASAASPPLPAAATGLAPASAGAAPWIVGAALFVAAAAGTVAVGVGAAGSRAHRTVAAAGDARDHAARGAMAAATSVSPASPAARIRTATAPAHPAPSGAARAAGRAASDGIRPADAHGAAQAQDRARSALRRRATLRLRERPRDTSPPPRGPVPQASDPEEPGALAPASAVRR